MRTRAPWLLVVPFLILARPTTELLGVGAVFVVLGLVLRGWSAGTIDKGRALAVSGPYAFTRNPLYLGSFLIGIGLSGAGGHLAWPLAFVAFFGAVYVRTMKREAEELLHRFGERYTEYAAQVPAFLPRPTPFRAGGGSDEGFRWSRYRRYREWEALVGAAAAIAVLAVRSRVGG